MLTIRETQMKVLGRARTERFILEAVALIRHHWRGKVSSLSSDDLVQFVEAALEKAASYGINGRRDVVRFLNLQLALGAAFDTDTRYPWAAIILAEDAFTPARKIERLCDFAREALTAPPREA